MLQKTEPLSGQVRERMIEKIDRGLRIVKGTVFLHTEPHHDDIMLGYLAHLYHLVRDATNVHYFANLTSGFTSVTNAYVLSVARKLQKLLDLPEVLALMQAGYFEPGSVPHRMSDVYLYLDGIAEKNLAKQNRAEAYRLLRNLVDVYRTPDPGELREHLKRLDDYLHTQYPGAKDPSDVQKLKGTFREWEVEL